MLSLRGIVKRYGKVTAVDGLSLELRRGEVFGLLGPNGAGKTTTLSIAVGLIGPDAGEAVLIAADGSEIGRATEAKVRARIGVCPQGDALYENLTARENLVFFATVHGMPKAERRARADELLEMVGLHERADHKVGGYSGGMRRRLNLAASLVHRPELVLLDEPTAGVDPHSRSAIYQIVDELRVGGTTVVYTTHSMDEAQRLCDRVAIIDHGRVLAVDTVDGLIDRHGGHAVVTVTRSDGDVRTETEQPLAVLAGVDLQSPDVLGVRIDRPDLESVFLSLTGRSLRD
ncbi:MAG: ABC transporter ATP-binding protein [Phycisphaerales bacterium]|nr:ABC transporter ATP-binding protein [Planctomycetota bacterium]MCH8507505.1 ABC transporter ATP-binding protein [Phycisphaerales bacterium]